MADQLIAAGQDPARAALEAIALDAYRSDRLSEADVRRLLNFDTRMDVHAFLKEHGIPLHYTYEDFVHDREVASQVADRAQRERQQGWSGQRPTG